MPLALQQEGGWARRGIVEDFAAFAEAVAERYGDRVKHWMVFNEPFSVFGHIAIGVHARYGPHPFEALQSVHHMNLACAEAGRRMRAVLDDDAQIGTTNVFTVAAPVRPGGRPAAPEPSRHRSADGRHVRRPAGRPRLSLREDAVARPR